jgi:hypothetical protein
MSDEAAWAEVRTRWQDEEAHRAYLGRANSLDDLAQVGRRYKEALDRSPGDPVALRWRDEVIRRASIQALSQIPRTPQPRFPAHRPFAPMLLISVAVLLAGLLAWFAWVGMRMFQPGGLP